MNEYKKTKTAVLKEQLMKEGYESCHLDDVVHDAASGLASDANNSGLDGQIEFLVDTCGWTTEDIINNVRNQGA